MARYLDRVTKQWYEPATDTGDCGAGYIRNPDLSGVVGVPQSRWVIDGDTVRAPTSEENAAFDAAELEAAKINKVAAIDERTKDLLENGSVTVNGEEVSTSLAAQVTLNGLKGLYDIGLLTFPQEISATNGLSYTVNSINDFKRVVGLVGTYVMTTKAAGRVLRAAVIAATSTAQVESVEDNR